MNCKLVFQNKDLVRYIVSYIVLPKYEILDWIKELIDENKKNESFGDLYKHSMNKYIESLEHLTEDYDNINWKFLSENIYAIDFLEKNIHKVYWPYLSKNKNAIHILKANIKNIDWSDIVYNQNATHIIRKYIKKVNIKYIGFHENETINDIILENFNKIEIDSLLKNKNAIYLPIVEDYILKYSNFIKTDKFIKRDKKYLWDEFFQNINAHYIFEKYENQLNWNEILKENCFIYLLINPNMYNFILRNYTYIGWKYLSSCTSPVIIKLLEQNIDKINWYKLSCNNSDDAIKLLKKYPDKIDYDSLDANSHFEAIEMFYQYYKLNKNNIDNFRIGLWVSVYIIQNKNIFIKNEVETNKRIDYFIEINKL